MTYTEAINSSRAVLVEFYATWCPHCQRMAPIVEQIKELTEGSATVIQLDIETNQELASTEDVESLPTFILYRCGKEMWRHTGEIAGETLLAKMQQYA